MGTTLTSNFKLYIEIVNTKRKWWQLWKPKKIYVEFKGIDTLESLKVFKDLHSPYSSEIVSELESSG